MAFKLVPFPSMQNGLAEVQLMLRGAEPDRVSSDFNVTPLGTQYVRLWPCRVKIAGFTWQNTDYYDVLVPPNVGSGVIFWRLVLRLTWGGDGSITAAPLLLPSASTWPSLTSTVGAAGTYDVPLARWYVGAYTSVVYGLVTDAPGPGIAKWQVPMSFNSGPNHALQGLSTGLLPSACRGPAPVVLSGDDATLMVTIEGVYLIQLSMYAALTNTDWYQGAAFARIEAYGTDVIEPVVLETVNGFSYPAFRATATAIARIPANTVITPTARITDSNQFALPGTATLTIERHAE